jgi:flagellar L-ring protein precursor FlgH
MRTENSKPQTRPPRTSSTVTPRLLNNLVVLPVLVILLAARLFAQMEFRSPVAGLFTDERLFKVGDVVTVVVNEKMQGVNNAQFRTQRGTTVSADFGAGPGKVFGLLNPFSGSVQSKDNFDSRVQNNKLSTFVTEISARVVSLTGIARSRDITGQNTIISSQLADLRLTMKGKGEAEDARRPSIFNRIFNWFF